MRRMTTCLVSFQHHADGCAQASLCRCFSHQINDLVQRFKQNALKGTRHVAEEPPLDGIELGAIRRIVGDSDFDADLVDKSLKFLFENECRQLLLPPASQAVESRRHWGNRFAQSFSRTSESYHRQTEPCRD